MALLAAPVAMAAGAADSVSETGGPIRLVPPRSSEQQQQDPQQDRAANQTQQLPGQRGRFDLERPPVYVPSEFERHVQKMVPPDVEIRRFGAELMTNQDRTAQQPAEGNNRVPADYLISIGDEVLVAIWGSVEADLRLTVDRGGRVTIPRVGPVLVAGLRYSELADAIDQRIGKVFRNYRVSASLGRLRSIRVYVTGFVQRPGAVTVSSLSTLVNALMQAGGPQSAGSFRNIELRRAGQLVTTFDFYDLLLKGDKTADRVLQAEDVVHVGAVGTQVALIGSVNRPGIFELKTGESVGDLVAMAGGFTAVADRSRLAIERVEDRANSRINELQLPRDGAQRPNSGDVVRAFSAADTALPQDRQNKRVRVEGEVQRPGEYILPANSTINDAIRVAGGMTSSAYVFGTDFSRESVRAVQQVNYDRALRDLELEFTRAATTQKASTGEDAAVQASRAQGSTLLIERLRNVRPSGRIVLQLTPDSASLPDLPVEDGDRLLIPAKPTTIGVFGSVFNGGSYLYGRGGTIGDFLRLAGGPTRGADTGSLFVLRANGSVVSSRQKTGWFMPGTGLDSLHAEAGDTIFVPEELNKTTLAQEVKEWTQILYQFGLGAAGLKVLKN
ncbi:SLBB domain-containing protein [Pelomonas sp. SE-A7]|uniref:SLBB domain-containing protein n=1 Tax=Pelomonas sp. SE-A7 TaxID=3054953 RepID=UPI00259C8C1B|nr:SLBB domain-containing protein [Pelomonas sp. SE-A7]MDM4767502.1 SLBB domain-containing protein [Pelomonas sp. SE-A7]